MATLYLESWWIKGVPQIKTPGERAFKPAEAFRL
jgi:hypothetical protein